MGETEARRGRPLLPRKAARGRGTVPTLTAATAPLASAYRVPGLDFLPWPEPPSPPRPVPQHGQSPHHPSLTVFPSLGTPHTRPFQSGSFRTPASPLGSPCSLNSGIRIIPRNCGKPCPGLNFAHTEELGGQEGD